MSHLLLSCDLSYKEILHHNLTPSESLASLHELAKCLTMELAVYLAKEVAAILRAVLTHETKKLYNDSTVHLLCSNYWIQPIYQELLHSSSRRNATRECERKRRSSGLARVTAYAKPPKQRRPSASVTGMVSCPLGPSGRRRTNTGQSTRLGWTRKWPQLTFPSNGRRLGPTDVCSSRSAIIGMAPGKATSGC